MYCKIKVQPEVADLYPQQINELLSPQKATQLKKWPFVKAAQSIFVPRMGSYCCKCMKLEKAQSDVEHDVIAVRWKGHWQKKEVSI
jgi:hypothetical protein